MSQTLPPELRSLVSRAVTLLGEVIRREMGESGYRDVETTRRRMAGLRGRSRATAYASLKRSLEDMRCMAPARRREVGHAFALMLELMNACENAYRAHRLKRRVSPKFRKKPHSIIYVLTAHPTEARSPKNLMLFHEIQNALVDALGASFESEEARLRHLLEVAWRLQIARRRKPTVEDEAEHIYSIVLREENLSALLRAGEELAPFYVRSWVGGDKDGHPGVDEKAMLASFSIARLMLTRYLRRRLKETRLALGLLHEHELDRMTARLAAAAVRLRDLRAGDGRRIMRLRDDLRALSERYVRNVGAANPALEQCERLMKVFPALVVPLELRESSEIITGAVRARRGTATAIERMLRKLAAVSAGASPKWYARGFIVSMCGSAAHLRDAAALVRRELGGLKIPVIPLFEQSAALESGGEITAEILRDTRFRAAVSRHWSGRLEIMLGYSDSSKEMGVLPSRLGIARAMGRLERECRRRRVEALFFHGSGGSVDRGGGSIQEQTAWWPASALKIYKATVQGEMVERSFASPEIMRGQLERIVERVQHRVAGSARHSAAVTRFAAEIHRHYAAKIASPRFLEVVQRATAYRYLSALRIGSRPAKRGAVTSVSALRAIPWILCWTQTRVLFPTWWGVGAAWAAASAGERRQLRRAFGTDALFRSYVKALGFTLAKVELPIWRIYLEASGLSPALVRATASEFEAEYDRAVGFVRAMSGKRDLLWFRPWLGTSIELRSPMIHPLNLIQILTLGGRDPALIRETVTGIASGMMTTG